MYRRHIRFGSFSSLYNHSRLCSCHHRGARSMVPAKVEHRTDGAAMTVNVQFIPMAVCPLLLFGSRHANPQQVRISPVDSFDDCLVLFLREFRLVGWGVRFNPDVRVDCFRFFPESDSAPFRCFP